MSDMQKSIRLRWKTRNHAPAVAAGGYVLSNDLSNKMLRRRADRPQMILHGWIRFVSAPATMAGAVTAH
jgi:hypothetical protein